jgi:REP element-mobilizing transposase RayT
MIVGYHVIFGAYGFWLPNDPRGSWSEFVGSWELFRYGSATKTTETRSLAHQKHNAAARREAKSSLKRSPVLFSGIQARAIANGFADCSKKSNLPIWACAILPDHVHLVVGATHRRWNSERWIENVVIQLKASATRQLLEQKLHPANGTRDEKGRLLRAFALGQWKVYLDPEDVPRSTEYVEANPEKEGKARQRWKFVVAPPPFDG